MLLPQIAERVWPAMAVHDTVQAIVRDPAFRQSLQRSLADILLRWLGEFFGHVQRLLRHAPAARTMALGFAGFIVMIVVARLILVARARNENDVRRAQRAGPSATDDPWQASEALFVAGRYEEAAHAIYRGVLAGLVHAERMRLDPSRTSGDYARELRRRASPMLSPFRAFTRRFHVAVYGHGECDAAAIDDLRALSSPFRARARAA